MADKWQDLRDYFDKNYDWYLSGYKPAELVEGKPEEVSITITITPKDNHGNHREEFIGEVGQSDHPS